MKLRFWLGILAFVVPTFPLGYVWHLVLFKDYYEALEIYRAHIVIPFGIASMLIQGAVWSYVYSRLFSSERVFAGAVKFAALDFPLAWSFLVLVIAAKHRMASVPGFIGIETAFTALQYLVTSPMIALAYSYKKG